jgi:hypothetical protein
MISDNGTWYTKMSYDMVEKEKSCSMTIIQEGRHSLSPFGEVVNDDDDVTLPPS